MIVMKHSEVKFGFLYINSTCTGVNSHLLLSFHSKIDLIEYVEVLRISKAYLRIRFQFFIFSFFVHVRVFVD